MSGTPRFTLSSPASALTVADLVAVLDEFEIWRPLPGFPYEVSSWGKVRRLGAVRPLKAARKQDGYRIVCLCKDAKKTMARVNRLVALVFWGPILFDGAEALHTDGNEANNRVANIRWGTRAENTADTERHGNRVRGSKHYGAVLTEQDVVALDQIVPQIGQREAGRRLGVAESTISKALKRETWKHVPKARATGKEGKVAA